MLEVVGQVDVFVLGLIRGYVSGFGFICLGSGVNTVLEDRRVLVVATSGAMCCTAMKTCQVGATCYNHQ